MFENKVFLSSPTMHGEEQKFIKEAFDTNWVAPLGANVDGFENELCEYVGVSHGAALSAGTAALHFAYKLAGIKRNDIVFCSDLTFSATVNPISYEGGKQVFVDCETDTWNMSPVALEKAFKKYPQAKAVALVNLYGTPAKLDEIKEICDNYSVPLIEDAAESLSATFKGKQTGTFGKYGVFSFNGNKIITTSGGGMLVCEDEDAIKKARFWATQSRDPAPYYQHSELGYNYRMSNIVAGIGRGQLLHLNEHRELKKRIYERYKQGFSGIDYISMNPYLDYTEPNFWLSCILLSDNSPVRPEDIAKRLAAENAETRPIWKPMHMQPYFESCDYITENDGESVSEYIFNNGLCLPSDIKMPEEVQNGIIRIIKALF